MMIFLLLSKNVLNVGHSDVIKLEAELYGGKRKRTGIAWACSDTNSTQHFSSLLDKTQQQDK